jgi:HlyD family secretion protein
LENTIIRAPATGTVTKVEVKLGEIASPGKAAVVLQDIDNLFVESNISEANISSIALGQTVEYSFDALGGSRKFYGKIVSVDPASTLVSGVVNYKITASIEGGEVKALVKSGMTANLAIEIARKNQVVTVPLKAIVSRDNQKFIRVVVDAQKPQNFIEGPVVLGLEGDGGMVEVVSGLNAGQQIVVSLEKK